MYTKRARIFKLAALATVVVYPFFGLAYAIDVTLMWDANTEPNLAGYRIYYDTNPGHPYEGYGAQEGASPIEIDLYNDDENPDPEVVEYTIDGLPDGEYYFAVTAFDDGVPPLESDYSNEVSTRSPDDVDKTSSYSTGGDGGGGGGCFVLTLTQY